MSSPKKPKLSLKDDSSNSEYLGFLQGIENCQAELSKIQEKVNEEIIKLEHKYAVEKQPLYAKREESISQIPNFWVTSLLNHADLTNIIDESDEEYLLFLTKIDVHINEDVFHSFKLLFYFKDNPYFTNTLFVKEYLYLDKSKKLLETVQITATPIIWKEGQDHIFNKLKEKKSFLYWMMSQDYGPSDIEIALIIKDDLWMNPLHFFLLPDNDQEEKSDDGEENDNLIIIDDSDDNSNPDDPENEESDGDSDESDNPTSPEFPQNGN